MKQQPFPDTLFIVYFDYSDGWYMPAEEPLTTEGEMMWHIRDRLSDDEIKGLHVRSVSMQDGVRDITEDVARKLLAEFDVDDGAGGLAKVPSLLEALFSSEIAEMQEDHFPYIAIERAGEHKWETDNER